MERASTASVPAGSSAAARPSAGCAAPASRTATAALTLSRGHYRISLRPLPRAGEASPPAKLAPCGAGFLGTRACCSRDKFKLLVLECT